MIQIESVWVVIFFAMFFMSVGGVLTQLIGWSIDAYQQKRKETEENEKLFVEAKHCNNCLHRGKHHDEYPCMLCDPEFNNWEKAK